MTIKSEAHLVISSAYPITRRPARQRRLRVSLAGACFLLMKRAVPTLLVTLFVASIASAQALPQFYANVGTTSVTVVLVTSRQERTLELWYRSEGPARIALVGLEQRRSSGLWRALRLPRGRASARRWTVDRTAPRTAIPIDPAALPALPQLAGELRATVEIDGNRLTVPVMREDTARRARSSEVLSGDCF